MQARRPSTDGSHAAGGAPPLPLRKPGEDYTVSWVRDEEVDRCMLCAVGFSLFLRRHHCRGCGDVVCASCAASRREVYGLVGLHRVCDACLENGVWVDPVARRNLQRLHEDEEADDAGDDRNAPAALQALVHNASSDALLHEWCSMVHADPNTEETQDGGEDTVLISVPAPIEVISSTVDLPGVSSGQQPDGEPTIGDNDPDGPLGNIKSNRSAAPESPPRTDVKSDAPPVDGTRSQWLFVAALCLGIFYFQRRRSPVLFRTAVLAAIWVQYREGQADH
ncbi:hypothetical protein ACHHYP_14609 [Achlya hypogyna]|uniref:FYVE-type domain-containing protein n=1 Tax=Achlya hypogyna TaxID=1202772 RepID=A0A1V9YCV7_ACHHY|nr:hypothetical protein ACHHYP_14609 [Achlya hypogyna]